MRSVFSKCIVDAAKADPKVLILTGDHGYALFDDFRKSNPEQFINAGIAETNMVGVAAGLAKAGFKPIVYGLSAFVPIRVLEQIKIDICYEGLPVILIGDGAGVVYSSLGSSHQSTEDIAALRAIPNISILSPCDKAEMQYAMDFATQFKSPVYIRMGKSDTGDVHTNSIEEKIGNLISINKGSEEIHFIATGSMVKTAISLSEQFDNPSVWSAPTIKPINEIQIRCLAQTGNTIVVFEEHSTTGGLGSTVAEIVAEIGGCRVIRLGISDRFSKKCGSYDYLLKEHEIDKLSLQQKLQELL